MTKRYLICFSGELTNFKLPELESIAKIYNIDIKYDKSAWDNVDTDNDSPFLYIEVNSEEDIVKIAKRSILIRHIYEIFSEGIEFKELLNGLNSNYTTEYLSDYLIGKTFKFEVEAYGRKHSQKQKLSIMEEFNDTPLWVNGTACMKPKPEQMENHIRWFAIEDWGRLGKDIRKRFFGKRICDGGRETIIKFNLTDRGYLGTTTMDPELSLISANMALVNKGDMMLDPFVGTGSFLYVSAHYGAYVIGCDIDMKQMKKQEDLNLETNFEQYKLTDQFLGIVLSDNSIPTWRMNNTFDQIITDPPYGIRAGAKRVGPKDNRKDVVIPLELQRDHIPQYVDYSVPEVMKDLLLLAAKTLKVGGRLVYWLPCSATDFKISELPTHPCLRLLYHQCYQGLSLKWGRRLITMEKHLEYQEASDDQLGQLNPQHANLRSIVHPKIQDNNNKQSLN
ncbi:tRNA guanosine-2'-O-methyltransferase 11 [Tieghemostelium lacteum]|uniref:tRNA (guanine(10)-N(2))-methyltransferase n=1 Tax=Tieghemostelium lacteum TaxID=361077 RepID=A0A152A4J7_TIELA|nr:tRNA guanosine-2'-O-methyltransferase 11 [Tieghemostelium lacteum]|eukprot:KYR01168.1 tRNA guanosine-2'-O-methyltransferase 11 [Tieghemostelium lacteum]